MLQLPLAGVHARLGALLCPLEGWEIPCHYGDPRREYEAVRGAAGLCDRSYRETIWITGTDRQEFLHGMVSNDVKSLRPGEGVYAVLLTPKGKMIADLWIYCLSEACVVVTEPATATQLAQTLGRYTLTSEVTIENRSADYGMLSLFGPRSAALACGVLGEPPTDPRELSHRTAEFNGRPVLLARSACSGEEGFDLLAPRSILEPLWLALEQSGAGNSLLAVGWTALEVLRVETGIPRFGQDMDHDTIPLEAGIESRALSFTKGCYMGQEIIARIVHRGHVNRKLAGLRLAPGSAIGRGEPIFQDEEPVGRITTAVLSPRFGPIALGYVRRELADPGRLVRIGATSANIVALPFYSRSPAAALG